MSKNNLCVGKQFNFLKNVTSEENETLKISGNMFTVAKGDIVFYEDEKLHKLFCICQGACKFSLIDENGNEHITKLLGQGDLMGRHAMISNKGALVTATALTDAVLCSLDKKVVLQTMQKNNDFSNDVLRGFADEMAEEIEKIQYFQNYKSLQIRLAGLLLYLSKKYGVDDEGWIKVSLKRQDFANILGTTTEYVISLLTKFKSKKYLKVDREKIKIRSYKNLRTIVKAA